MRLPDPDDAAIGRRLRQARAEARVTQAGAAAAPGERARARHQRGEGFQAGAGGAQHLGDALRARPALAPVRHDALGDVEGGRVESRALGEPGHRKTVFRGERVDRPPDILMLHLRPFPLRGRLSPERPDSGRDIEDNITFHAES